MLTLHEYSPQLFPFLLESVSTSPLSRYSILFACPQERFVVEHGADTDFLDQLDQRWASTANKVPPDTVVGSDSNAWQHLPFRGGWFLFLAYELAGQIEPVLDLPADEQGLPLACAVRIPVAVVVDHLHQCFYLLAEDNFASEYHQLQQLIEELQLTKPKLASTDLLIESPIVPTLLLQEEDSTHFMQGVETLRDYIRAGDVFQVNLSRCWQAAIPAELNAVMLYQRLRRANPAPFACLADFGDFSIVSSSPERLVSVKDGWANTRPIAGTRPRAADPVEDQRWLDELIAHPKERAEHIMLIDLERNDLGRVCEYGTIQANELMVVESYQHVHHIVSNVKGKLREGITPGQVIRAVFPGGTITGCPKVRCMEIIAELEQTGRGAYTGSVGYLNHDGEMDLNILIRTMSINWEKMVFRTGAGIVIDSEPRHELKETRHKARGILRALGDKVS